MVEMIIAMVIAGVVMAAVYQLLIVQSRVYGQQRELMDVHETLRSAATLLAWEIRQSWAAGGDLYSIDANSITLRSTRGGGTVCVKDPILPAYGLRGAALGDLTAAPHDSALVYIKGANWNAMEIADVLPPVEMGIGNCVWAGGGAPDLAVKLTVDFPSDTAGIQIGAPFRAFLRVQYGLYQDAGDGRWWLGRKVSNALSYEKLTGPLLAPASGGLVFTYRDAAGNVTANPTQVVVIDFVIRAESYRRSGNALELQQDTLATRVALRG